MTAYGVRYIGPPLSGAEGPHGWEIAEGSAWRTPETAVELALVARCIRIVAACPRGWSEGAGARFIGPIGVSVEQLDQLEVVAIVERLTSFVGHEHARPFAELVCEALGHQAEARVASCPGCYFEGDIRGPIRRAFAEQLHAAGWRADVLGDAKETAKGAAMMLTEFGPVDETSAALDRQTAALLQASAEDRDCDELGPDGDHSKCPACLRDGPRTWTDRP